MKVASLENMFLIMADEKRAFSIFEPYRERMTLKLVHGSDRFHYVLEDCKAPDQIIDKLYNMHNLPSI